MLLKTDKIGKQQECHKKTSFIFGNPDNCVWKVWGACCSEMSM